MYANLMHWTWVRL